MGVSYSHILIDTDTDKLTNAQKDRQTDRQTDRKGFRDLRAASLEIRTRAKLYKEDFYVIASPNITWTFARVFFPH